MVDSSFIKIKDKRYNILLVQYYYPDEYVTIEPEELTSNPIDVKYYTIILCFKGTGISSTIKFLDESERDKCLNFLDGSSVYEKFAK